MTLEEMQIPAADSVKFPFKCKAAVMDAYNKPLVLREIQVEEPKYGQCFVKVAAVGLCYSDVHILKDEWPALAACPMVLGHEGSGVVVKTGPGVSRFQPGDHVIFLFTPNCGVCEMCQVGRPSICKSTFARAPGLQDDGSSGLTDPLTGKPMPTCLTLGLFSEYTTVGADQLCPVKKSIPLNRASLVGCAVMTGIGAVLNTAKATVGTTCVVVGCGGVGLNAVQGARLCGCDKIIAIDLLPSKLDFAKTFGATHTINGKEVKDTVAEVLKLVPGGVDYVIDCIGSVKVLQQGFSMIKSGGTVVAVGIAPQTHTLELNAFELALTEKRIMGSLYGSARPQVDMPRLLNLYEQKRLLLDELVSKEYTLDQINEGLDALIGGSVARGLVRFY